MLTPEEAQSLLAERGVKASVQRREVEAGVFAEGFVIDRPDLLRALDSLPDAERLHWKLWRLVLAARDNVVRVPVNGTPCDVGEYVSFLAAGYLIGLSDDRDEVLGQLWDVHEQWQQARGDN